MTTRNAVASVNGAAINGENHNLQVGKGQQISKGNSQEGCRRSSADDNDSIDDRSDALFPDLDLQSSLLQSASFSEQPLRRQRSQFRSLIRSMGDYVAYTTLLSMLVVIPIVLYNALKNRNLDLAAFHSARVMTLGTVVLGLRLVYLHLTHWYMPQAQKYVVRILWMVPIYSIQSYLSLRFHESRIYLDTVRDVYEAYVIASFVYYLIELLGGQEALIQILLQKSNTTLGHHSWPLSLILQPWELGEDFLLQCKHGVLQYVVFKVIATFVTYVCEISGVYQEGKFAPTVAYPYICFFQNISVMYALYCLVLFYSAINEELRHPVDWKPLGKFLCVKGVVFFTWWQGVVIFYLKSHGIIGDLGEWSSAEVAYGLINYCIVIEMVGFAIAHSYTFPYTEYLPESMTIRAVREEEDDDMEPPDLLERRSSTYRPPATLQHPMGFRDALYSSALPKETFEDIQTLRSTVLDSATYKKIRASGISINDISTMMSSFAPGRAASDEGAASETAGGTSNGDDEVDADDVVHEETVL